MESSNVIAIPPHYKGTSFDEMTQALVVSAGKMNIPIEITGQVDPLENNLKGGLLDDESYIEGQIAVISELTRRKGLAKVLFLDFFNPGLDILRYAHLQRDLRCKYGSILSGGSFLSGDLYSFDWLSSYETAWANTYDSIYTPSRYIESQLPEPLKKKTKFMPHGMDAFSPATSPDKKYDVIFPHRLNEDKGIVDLIDIAKGIPEAKIAIPVPQKQDQAKGSKYYDALDAIDNIELLHGENDEQHALTLASSKIVLSCAKQELFGYSVMKSVLSGCHPVLPNDQCYPYFFPRNFLYRSNEEAVQMIKDHLRDSKHESSEALDQIRGNIRDFTFKTILSDFFEEVNP